MEGTYKGVTVRPSTGEDVVPGRRPQNSNVDENHQRERGVGDDHTTSEIRLHPAITGYS